MLNRTNELAEISYAAVALLNDDDKLDLTVLSGGQEIDKDDPKQSAILILMGQIQNLERSAYRDREKYIASQTARNWTKYLDEHEVNSLWSISLRDEGRFRGFVV